MRMQHLLRLMTVATFVTLSLCFPSLVTCFDTRTSPTSFALNNNIRHQKIDIALPIPPSSRRIGSPLLSSLQEGQHQRKEVLREDLRTSDELDTVNYLKVDRIERFSRLPVWPVWNGVVLWFISRIFGSQLASRLEEVFGGRVCPNFFPNDGSTSPFVMLVHHSHSFGPNPLRLVSGAILPEGFPSHPHRGFVTVTYFLKGGFQHRDSMGIQQRYGARSDLHHHTQWLQTGAGLLHEEMFDFRSDSPFTFSQRQELYQLWLNIPASEKMNPPRVELLSSPEDCPVVMESTDDKEVRTVVLAGSYRDATSTAPIQSPIGIFHTLLNKRGCEWSHHIPRSHETIILYLRQGRIELEGGLRNEAPVTVEAHETAFFRHDINQSSSSSSLKIRALEDDTDFLILTGMPFKGEPIAAQGSMVMNSAAQVQQAYMDYENGFMGVPWDHKLTDTEWKEHVRRNPSRYRPDTSL